MLDMYNPYGLNNAFLPPKFNKIQANGPGNLYGMQANTPGNPYGAYGMHQYINPYLNPNQHQYMYQGPCPCSAQGQYHMPGTVYGSDRPAIQDYGPAPLVINIEEAASQNNTFRSALWTGKHLQVTLMNIRPGEDIGLEIHPDVDQFIRIEDGNGFVMIGDSRDRLDFRRYVSDDHIIVIPAGKWHNLVNIGREPLKLYSIYAPPQHPHGTVHQTKAEAEAAERSH